MTIMLSLTIRPQFADTVKPYNNNCIPADLQRTSNIFPSSSKTPVDYVCQPGLYGHCLTFVAFVENLQCNKLQTRECRNVVQTLFFTYNVHKGKFSQACNEHYDHNNGVNQACRRHFRHGTVQRIFNLLTLTVAIWVQP